MEGGVKNIKNISDKIGSLEIPTTEPDACLGLAGGRGRHASTCE